MSVNVFSVPNYLRTSDSPFMIRSVCPDMVEIEELVNRMAEGRTTLTKPDIAGCIMSPGIKTQKAV